MSVMAAVLVDTVGIMLVAVRAVMQDRRLVPLGISVQ